MLVFVVALYIGLPELDGLSDTMRVIKDADPVWIAVALGFNVLSFVSYIALFRGVIGGRSESRLCARLDWRTSYQITMAGLAATRLFSAGGAGGIALTYWALRRAGMKRREAARRMVAFLVLLYTVYLAALVICGILLRVGLFPGSSPVGMTIVPAALAGVALIVLSLVSLIPATSSASSRAGRRDTGAVRLAAADRDRARDDRGGDRKAMSLLRHPAAACLPSSARSDSGPPTSPCCGRASTPSARTFRQRYWCRASSSG